MKHKLSSALSEAQIQRQIMEWLTLRGVFAWRSNTGAVKVSGNGGKDRFVRFGMPGCADIVGMISGKVKCNLSPPGSHCWVKGRFLAIEVKSAAGKLSVAQQSFKMAVESNGGLYIEAHALDEVIKALGA